jgi:SAM-dependent methyltransferase
MSEVSQANASQVAFWNSEATRSWAEHHEAIDRLLSDVATIALQSAAARPGEHVLDIGCGSGTTVLELAQRVGPGGHVLGVDVAATSVARAAQRIAEAGLSQAEVLQADAASHAFAPQATDLVFSRFGVMFFAEPTTAFANIRRALKPGGRVVLAVFRSRDENRWATGATAALGDLLPPAEPQGPEEPGQFSWADPERVRRILEGAGLRDVRLTPHDPRMHLADAGGGAAQALQFALHFGPVGPALRAEPEKAAEVRARLLDFYRGHEGPQGAIVMPGAIWIVTAGA